jgi:dTDP-glucose 4,6-dehydratase
MTRRISARFLTTIQRAALVNQISLPSEALRKQRRGASIGPGTYKENNRLNHISPLSFPFTATEAKKPFHEYSRHWRRRVHRLGCLPLSHSGHRAPGIQSGQTYYASNLGSLASIQANNRYEFIQGDICNQPLVESLLRQHGINAVLHLAAESHVDRSIDAPTAFIETNIKGTYVLLEAARQYWSNLPSKENDNFRFHHVSTDEVFGELPFDDSKFTEKTAYKPSSPYSASKAAADHLVRAWHSTYGLPAVLSNCSNNYGPYHFPEKLIPLTILNALEEKPVNIYGTGNNVRDWLHVEDHSEALVAILERGRPGQSYNIGGSAERSNLNVAESICDIIDGRRPLADGKKRRNLIRFVSDRPGHDRRYAINASKIKNELGWTPKRSFEEGIEDTVGWYLENEEWWRPLRENRYPGGRLGAL